MTGYAILRALISKWYSCGNLSLTLVHRHSYPPCIDPPSCKYSFSPVSTTPPVSLSSIGSVGAVSRIDVWRPSAASQPLALLPSCLDYGSVRFISPRFPVRKLRCKLVPGVKGLRGLVLPRSPIVWQSAPLLFRLSSSQERLINQGFVAADVQLAGVSLSLHNRADYLTTIQ